MLTAILVSCLLSVVAANFCCTPTAWEGNMGIIIGSVKDGQTHLTEGSMTISYDATRKIISTKQTLMVDGIPVSQLYIEDFNAGVSYRISDDDGSCLKSNIGQWVPNCIPDNATEGGLRYGLGDDAVDAKAYMVDYNTYQVYYVVTADTCVPMAEDVTGVFDGGYVMEAITFSNIIAGVTDPSVFNIPTQCGNAPLVPLPGIGSKRNSPLR